LQKEKFLKGFDINISPETANFKAKGSIKCNGVLHSKGAKEVRWLKYLENLINQMARGTT
jgi:hypothetical protein